MNQQVLRTIDKRDRIGVDGVVDLLQKPAEEFGAGINPLAAEFIGNALRATPERLMSPNDPKVIARLEMLTIMDERGELDALLAMPANADQTWRDGGRPENIAWALDDIMQSAAR